jgi:HD-GYP domain-containing protein (c-di-GMP phosphodiesterase class II)
MTPGSLATGGEDGRNGADPVYDELRRHTRALRAALGYRDRYTWVHSERVVGLCEAMGARAGLWGRERGILRFAATFHDVGKIGIPDRILLKPALLDEDESMEMKQHPELGARIVLATEVEGSEEFARVIRHHHEHFDGGGYPAGLAGEEIPVCSRIVGIADSYDAMALARSYRVARSHAEIMEILRAETGGKHDPFLMRVFGEIVEESEYRSRAGEDGRPVE